MYVISCDSRTKCETLFLVNRRKQKASFWSNRLDADSFGGTAALLEACRVIREAEGE